MLVRPVPSTQEMFILSMQSTVFTMPTYWIFHFSYLPANFFLFLLVSATKEIPLPTLSFPPSIEFLPPSLPGCCPSCHPPLHVYSLHYQILTEDMTHGLCFAQNCKTAVLLAKIIILWYWNILNKMLWCSNLRLWITSLKTKLFTVLGLEYKTR